VSPAVEVRGDINPVWTHVDGAITMEWCRNPRTHRLARTKSSTCACTSSVGTSLSLCLHLCGTRLDPCAPILMFADKSAPQFEEYVHPNSPTKTLFSQKRDHEQFAPDLPFPHPGAFHGFLRPCHNRTSDVRPLHGQGRVFTFGELLDSFCLFVDYASHTSSNAIFAPPLVVYNLITRLPIVLSPVCAFFRISLGLSRDRGESEVVGMGGDGWGWVGMGWGRALHPPLGTYPPP
jgi:hypothetical protein